MNYLSEASIFSLIRDKFRDAGTVARVAKDALSDNSRKSGPYLGGSLSNYSKDLIMTFPVLCDNTLPPETASMISRANERYIITMLHLLFASEQIQGSGGKDVLKKIHNNIKNSMSIDDYIDACDSIYKKISGIRESTDMCERARRSMSETLKQPPKRYPESSFSTKSLNDYKVLNLGGKTVVKEADPNLPPMTGYSVSGLEDPYRSDDSIDRASKISKIASMQRDEYRKGLDQARREREALSNMQDIDTQHDIFAKMLVDSDVKKANELAPSLMILNFVTVEKTNSGEEVKVQHPFIAGVKSRLVSVDGMDIVERIASKNKTRLSFTNLIRATTGEIRFLRDFILSIDQAKINAKNAAKKGMAAKMWDTLEFRATKNNRRKLQRSGNDASAITTLVINQETANFIKKEYDFDIESPKNAKMIMDSYNLLGIIICDESIELAKIMYAGNDSFEQQAYSYLEKESNDKSYKKVVNLIGQMNGR
jgi:hypothetical protein